MDCGDIHNLLLGSMHTFQQLNAEFIALSKVGRLHFIIVRDIIIYFFSAVQFDAMFGQKPVKEPFWMVMR